MNFISHNTEVVAKYLSFAFLSLNLFNNHNIISLLFFLRIKIFLLFLLSRIFSLQLYRILILQRIDDLLWLAINTHSILILSLFWLSLVLFFFHSHFCSAFQFLLSYFVHPITYVQTVNWIICLECGHGVGICQIAIVDILLKTQNSYSIFLTFVVYLRNFIINKADQLTKNKSKLLFLLLQLASFARVGQDMSIIRLVIILIGSHIKRRIASILGGAEDRFIFIRPVFQIRLLAFIIFFIIRINLHKLIILLFQFLLQLLIYILLFLLLELFLHLGFSIFILGILTTIYIISISFYSLVFQILFYANLLLISLCHIFYLNVLLVIMLLFYFGWVGLGRVEPARVVCLLQHFLNLYVFLLYYIQYFYLYISYFCIFPQNFYIVDMLGIQNENYLYLSQNKIFLIQKVMLQLKYAQFIL